MLCKFGEMAQRNITGGIIYITISSFVLYSLIFYNKSISAPFLALTNTDIDVTVLKKISAFCSNVTVQFFGISSYIIIIIMLIRGMSFFYWRRSKFKYQRLWLLILLVFIPVLYNIMSTYPIFQNVLSSNKFDCYAGGYVGYAFSKLIFIDMLGQKQVFGWQIVLSIISILWLIQYVCCFHYITLIKDFKRKKYKKVRNFLYRFYAWNKKISIYFILNIKILFLKVKKILNQNYVTNKSSRNNLEQKYKKQLLLTKATINNLDADYMPEENTDLDNFNFKNLYPIKQKPDNFECNKMHHAEYQTNSTEDAINFKSSAQDFCEGKCFAKDENENILNDSEIFNNKTHEYVLPSIDLLDKHIFQQDYNNSEVFDKLSKDLLKAMGEFSIKGEILKVKPGPIITVFEFKPAPGIKTARIISLADDIARTMSAVSARISTIPGRNVLGIELPNKDRQTVYLSELFSCDEFKSTTNGIQLVLGKDTNGTPVFADLTKMPHLLISGTTGSGKSVSINDMILSILFKFKPNECKLIMIDPKMLELSVYEDIPHLLIPVVTDPKKAVSALKWAVSEMEQRYRNMARFGVRNIAGFNKKLNDAQKNPELLVKKIQTGFDSTTGKPVFESQKLDFVHMPYIVVFVDEMADLMLIAGKEVETAIQRLAQMARAAGIHLIMATQRPSVDVVTGTIKANFPTRISFQVSSKIDSRTILGEHGAEQLLGQGDMLYMSGVGRLVRVQAPLIQDIEITRVVDFIKSQKLPNYVDVLDSDEHNMVDSEQLTIVHSKKR